MMRAMAKNPCPVTRDQFADKATPLKVVINGQELQAEVKEFSTGSFGWYLNGKILVPIDGKTVSVQIGMNLTIVGSKDAPPKAAGKDAAAAPADAASDD